MGTTAAAVRAGPAYPLTRDDRQVLQPIAPVVEDAGKPYAVRIADVPQSLQDELREW
ncbi:MAG: hypothetical protein PPHEINF_4582 [uncultured Paraburkholderia sp.]|nr:MAG: hypothetical protein PPHEINF_4582 [uncultured Paraburkholderia sp.]CAH2800572.1 MAG: hypothetical protein PPHEESC_4637 [uncultured Paraburkholderia sp.]CAH2935828.1 MAG: hypothetical protein PPHEMADMSA_4640 [uncultured Paraburkholderia sp.]CAH2937126.1 MAG: hypothetical protein PPHERAN_4608 [uncultured Paraburkholderia sp.]